MPASGAQEPPYSLLSLQFAASCMVRSSENLVSAGTKEQRHGGQLSTWRSITFTYPWQSCMSSELYNMAM